MIQPQFKKIGFLFLLLALQVLVFNHVNIYGYATPLICIYFILTLPSSTAIWAKLLWAFGIGLLQDMFASTPGMMSAALPVVAFCQSWLVSFFGGQNLEDDKDANSIPSIRSLGLIQFLRYSAIAIFIQNVIFYILETFSFFSIGDLLTNIIGSTILTTLIVWAMDSIRNAAKKKTNQQ